MGNLTENDVRLMRQRLLALDEGRDGDARLIAAYLIKERQLNLTEATRDQLSPDWLDYWGVPATPRRFILMMDHGREPVYRIPANYNSFPPPMGSMEVPFWVPDELDGSVRLDYEPMALEAPKTKSRMEFLRRFLLG